MRCMITWTTYGYWLQGDPRGFRTRKHKKHVPSPARYAKDSEEKYDFSDYEKLFQFAKRNTPNVVRLSDNNIRKVALSVEKTLQDQSCRFALVSVGPYHVHLLIEADELSIPSLCKLLKGRSSRLLGDGTTWARGYHTRYFQNALEMTGAINYIRKHSKEGAIVKEIRLTSPGL